MSPKVLRVVKANPSPNLTLAPTLTLALSPTPTPTLTPTKVLRVVKAPSSFSGGPSQSGAQAPADPARFHGPASWTASWAERLAPHLRSYASCARASTSLPGLNVMGGVSVLLINTHPSTSFHVALDNLPVLDEPKAHPNPLPNPSPNPNPNPSPSPNPNRNRNRNPKP